MTVVNLVTAPADSLMTSAPDGTRLAVANMTTNQTDVLPVGVLLAPVRDSIAAEAAARQTAIEAAISALVAGAPGTMNTLNEIATQLASDESATATLVNSVAAALPKASIPVSAGVLSSDVNRLPVALTLGTGLFRSGTSLIAGMGTITSYTTSGPIATTDDLALVNGTSGSLAMTLAPGTVDRHQITIKRYGAAIVSITAMIDGMTSTLTLSNAVLKEATTLIWVSSASSWVLL